MSSLVLTSLAVGSGESEGTVALEVFGTQQTTSPSILTRVVCADRRPVGVLTLRDVLAGHRLGRQVDRKTANAQLH